MTENQRFEGMSSEGSEPYVYTPGWSQGPGCEWSWDQERPPLLEETASGGDEPAVGPQLLCVPLPCLRITHYAIRTLCI